MKPDVTLAWLFTICSIILLSVCFSKCSSSQPSPVEENVTIDSLTTINDTLVIKINNLDSIKNAKAIEVKVLDNDSTLELFYKLIRE